MVTSDETVDEFAPIEVHEDTARRVVPDETDLEGSTDSVVKLGSSRAVRSIQQILDQEGAAAEVANSGPVPEPSDLENNENFGELIQMVDDIAKRYRAGDVDLMVLERDLVSLVSILVSLNAMVGYQEGLALNAEGLYKTALERMFLKVRQASLDRNTRLPELVMKAMARDNCEEVRQQWWKHQMASLTVKGYYYAAKHLAEVMDHMSARLRQERIAGARSGQT